MNTMNTFKQNATFFINITIIALNWSIEYELKETVLHDDVRYVVQIYNQ